MNRTTIILLILFLLLAGGAWWYLSNRSDQMSSGSESELDFAVDNIEEVQKVFIADRSGNEPITLERQGDQWLLNGQYKPRKTALALVLNMVQHIQVRNRPTREMRPLILETLASEGITVEVYGKNNRLLRKYIIGGVTANGEANFIIKDGSNTPFIGNIKNFVGNMRTRLLKPSLDDWRDQAVLDFDPEKIQAVSIEYPKQRDKSFILRRKGQKFTVAPFFDLSFKPEASTTNQSIAEAYLEYFDRIPGESFLNDFQHTDRIRQMVPFAILTVTTRDGKEHEATFYPFMRYDPQQEEFYISEEESFFRYWVDLSSGDFMLVQMPQVKEIFRGYGNFVKK